MMSRNAEALFWIGRYMERVENHARLMDVHYHLQSEDVPVSPREGEGGPLCKWGRIVDALGSRSAYEEQYGSYNEYDVLQYMTLDRDNPNSLAMCAANARGNVRTLREKLPSELWDAVNGFYLWLREKQAGDLGRESPHSFFSKVKDWTALFQGVCQSVMPRENEWHFIECGRYLERAENTLRILRSVESCHLAASPVQAAGEEEFEPYAYLQAVLRSVSGGQPFRRYYADGVSFEAVVEFLVLNPVFPRSVHYSLHALENHLHGIELQDKQLRASHDRIGRRVGKIKAELICLERDDLAPEAEGRTTVHLMLAMQQLGIAFAQTFFRIGEATA